MPSPYPGIEAPPVNIPMLLLEPVFKEQQNTEIPMPSSRVLYCGVDEKLVNSKDVAGDTRFLATYAQLGFGRAVMKASIRAKIVAGERNTDLYAGLLLERTASTRSP